MKNFSIKHRQVDSFDILELSGELDAHTASQLEDSLKKLIDREQHQIIVNCRELDYIASATLYDILEDEGQAIRKFKNES